MPGKFTTWLLALLLLALLALTAWMLWALQKLEENKKPGHQAADHRAGSTRESTTAWWGSPRSDAALFSSPDCPTPYPRHSAARGT
jgi:hypothetical protein